MVHIDVRLFCFDGNWHKSFHYLVKLLLHLGAGQLRFKVSFAIELGSLDIATATYVCVLDAEDNAIRRHDLLVRKKQDIANSDVLELDWDMLLIAVFKFHAFNGVNLFVGLVSDEVCNAFLGNSNDDDY